ncbi:hypothetical protein HK44_025990 [Pseudomonas fluorescens HK44]|uniref:Uncharacterized protein n=1 Tax=Pseudomonas fluorescens HK44 TaxID=1042209 RepID=A0A010S3W9_PSEFL|nr:hypothetical protein HK44_025990 [Pseudomonas fluorescens HK44]
MNIAPRAFKGFTLIGALMLILGVFALNQMSKIRAAGEDIVQNNVPSIKALGEFTQLSLRQRVLSCRLLTNSAIVEINERNLVIASAAEEQAQVAREVDRNLVNIRDLSVQSATGANQTSAASNELSRLALDLNNMVGRFSL